MNEKEWIDRLRQKEQDYMEPAPDGLWDEIDKGLTSVSSHQKPKVNPVWYRIGGIAAAVALIIGLGSIFLFFNNNPQPVLYSDSNPAIKIEKQESMDRQPVVKSMPSNVLAQNTAIQAQHTTPVFTEVSERVPVVPADNTETREVISIDTITVSSPINSPEKNIPDNTNAGNNRDYYLTGMSNDIIIPKRHNTVTLTAYAGNMMVNSNSSQSGYTPIVSSLIPDNRVLLDTPVGSNPATDILLGNQGEEVGTKTTHKLPIRFGVNVSISIYNKLGIETGITYSILSSSTTSGSKSDMFDTDQKLHYIGIPLKATYEIWGRKSFGIYATGGGMVEKCVYGRSVTDFVIGNEVASSETEKIKERQLQFSVNAGLGIKWNITDYMNLFIEPGTSYYFDNHSDVINSYKDKPLNFDMKIGLSFNINH